MKKYFIIAVFLVLGTLAQGQEKDDNNLYTNSADKLLQSDSRLMIGGYGEVHYNQPLDGDVYSNGDLDIHRIVMLFGYNFSERTKFVTELEFEHVKEVYVEQAFLQYKLNNFLNFRGGLLLIPIGVINEYHEPTTFNGVERPLIDNTISPTTWREVGFGINGNIIPASLKYQAYLVNGFNGYDGDPHLSGLSGLRKGRQKGAESFMSAPNFTGKVEYYGIKGLNIGISGYFGKTQSTLYDGLDKNDDAKIATVDSSVVGITMMGMDARYNWKGIMLKGQFYYAGLSNTEQYNVFTADGTLNDVGSSMIGYYGEIGYNVLRSFDTKKRLIPFVRYEYLNTHHSVESNIEKNAEYEKDVITTGLTLELSKGAVVKTDIQFVKAGNADKYSLVFNAGFGVMF